MSKNIIPFPVNTSSDGGQQGKSADMYVFPHREKVIPSDISPTVVDAIVARNKEMQENQIKIPTPKQEPILTKLEALQVVHDLLGVAEQFKDFDERKRLQIARDIASALGNLTDQQKSMYRTSLGHIGMISALIQSELK